MDKEARVASSMYGEHIRYVTVVQKMDSGIYDSLIISMYKAAAAAALSRSLACPAATPATPTVQLYSYIIG